MIVYKDGNGRVQWETAADALTRTVVHQQYDRLAPLGYAPACRKKKLQLLTDELAKALFLGLSEQMKKRRFDALTP